MKKAFFYLLMILNAASLQAQDNSLYKKYWFVQNADTLPYRLLLPQNFDNNKKYPLIIVLHGSGERGSDNEKQLIHGGALFLKEENRNKYPAIVVFPQCQDKNFWSNTQFIFNERGERGMYFLNGGEPSVPMKLLMALTENLQKQFKVRQDQIYVMGLSMGGMGTFEVVNRMPYTFAAALPICGGANPSTAAKLKGTKWWVFHGAKDDVVAPKLSEDMVKAMKRNSVDVKFTLYPNANHNSWDSAFAEPDLLKWMFAQKRYFSIEIQTGDR